ncbi:MAG: hypothetical protein DMF82_17435 [Acidobacteria bacterium]|nr:MAG: hypothetical protein DMF82_17435 [Acidobacteriota bacterium]
MGRSRSRALVGATFLLGLFAGASAPRVAAQAPAPADAARPHKSVYGKLASVDKTRNGIVMKSDAGERLSWRFDAAVIAEAARFKPGDPMIVIYRQIAPNQKRVTALAFPGSATTPLYVNTTGSRVVVRSSPAVNGECGGPNAGSVSESTIPSGGVAEVLEACWCCAVPGESCNPGNKSGLGRALLVQCFE